jgi:glutathione S-transferase
MSTDSPAADAADRTGTTERLTLYRLQACPFCERVVRRLDELDIAYESRFVEPRHSDRDVVKRISGKRTVPAIVDPNTGVAMSESANIVAYLDGTYDDGDEAA